MFFVRVLLFMMSRRAETVETPILTASNGTTRQSYRARVSAERERIAASADAHMSKGKTHTDQMFRKALRQR